MLLSEVRLAQGGPTSKNGAPSRRDLLVIFSPHLSHKYRSAAPGDFANLGNVLAGRSIEQILATLTPDTWM
jgi:hypothetical protein